MWIQRIMWLVTSMTPVDIILMNILMKVLSSTILFHKYISTVEAFLEISQKSRNFWTHFKMD